MSSMAGYARHPALAAWLLLLTLIFLIPAMLSGHESQPGVVNITALGGDRYEVVWKAPIYYSKPHPAKLQMPENWQIVSPETRRHTGDAIVFTNIVTIKDNDLNGSVLRFPGLEATITDVFIRTRLADGSSMTTIARPTKPWAELRGARPWYETAQEYLFLGFHHILLGIDHLLFVLGLLLIVQSRMMLIKTITSFTVAHSITLGAATLGYAQVPLPPLNAAIALSILFLGPEIVRAKRNKSSLTIEYPWLIAFGFGLLHGFGFASGLSTTGMPQSELPWALLCFNVGVEIGQLLFVFIALGLVRAFQILRIIWPAWIQWLPAYTVGGLGAYWTIQRTAILIGAL